MESRMTVVQALDEKDLLVKKIRKRTQKAFFVDIIRAKGTLTWERRLTSAAFKVAAEGELQQIRDLIERYDRLNEAVLISNAQTFLDTSRGKMTVSCAIALRNRLRGSGPYGELTDFEGNLAQRLEERWQEEAALLRKKNENVRRETGKKKPSAQTKTSGKIVMLSNPENASKTDRRSCRSDAAEGREKAADRMRMIDPLNIRQLSEEMQEQREALLQELDTKIKISNATTYVTLGGGQSME